MNKHILKILPEYANAVYSHEKTFEVRINDRDFHVGDIIIFNVISSEFHPLDLQPFKITYILSGGSFGLQENYVVLAIRPTFI